jgi:hypothetical protein
MRAAVVYGKSLISASLNDLENNVSNSSLADFKFEKNHKEESS